MKTFLSTLALCTFTLLSFAKDHIYLKNNDVIECKVTEIGQDEVKYTLEKTDELIYVIATSKIQRIILENGQVHTFTEDLNNVLIYETPKTQAWKMGLFSLAFNAFSLGYERSIKPGQSLDFGIGLIGVGKPMGNLDGKGGYLKAGYKFYISPDYTVNGMKRTHLMQGWYFKPTINLAVYNRKFYQNNYPIVTETTKDVVASSFELVFGKQFIMGNLFLVDFNIGAGYGFDNITSSDYGVNDYNVGPEYHYGFTLGSNVPISFSTGFKIGLLSK